MSALLDPRIHLVTLSGIAGTGKTLLALAAGLQQMPSTYSKMMVSRPVVPMGKGIGFLPGTLAEKMDPWMGPIYDNLDFLINSKKKRKESKPWDALIHQGLLEVEALAFIRGRSIPELFMIIDEAQNLTPHEVKTVLTRAGKGTKVILTGDPNQIDNPYVDSQSNGLSYAIEKFKGSKLAAHVTLVKGERSDLAEEAALIL
jgi:PhoH-like ATPase